MTLSTCETSMASLSLTLLKDLSNLGVAFFPHAVKSQLRTKPAALPKDGGRSAPSAPAKGKKAQKDSPAPSPQGAAETEVPAKRRTEKSKRQEAPRETVNRFAPLAMDAEDTINLNLGGFLHP
ncbi:hypothetical protein PoB_002723400 [Plakobranchus ocellatus]|uniref:Uncharacterized protein n=1 Tax=Plakobranchus ocellatus TaxID=259542 RepID=A0AAV4A2C0_9GAST|nr:hypothetical protein PoB_002723400 [Plakobranchus ocellatus]